MSTPEPIRDPNETDEALVAAFLTGAEPDAACRTLVHKYWPTLVSSIRLRVRNERDAEEIAQDTLAKAFRSVHRLESRRCFAAWLFRIASNQTTDFLRRSKRTVSLEELADKGFVPATEESDDLESRELVTQVLDAVGRLPEKYRLAITLRYLLGMPAKRMAKQLGEPEGTIRNRVFRALEKLKGMLDDDVTPATRKKT